MYRKIYFLILFFFGLTLNVNSQNGYSDFKCIESQGEIPKDFSKYLNHSKFNNTTLSYIFKSGLVVYGTELNQYLENILDRILMDYPDIRKEIRIYIFKSAVVNAMAFEDNVIIVNMGLLAQVQNESELAFILSHELVHIVNKHIEKENKKEKKDKSKEQKNRSNSQGRIESFMSYHYRSREHEVEADKEGIEKYYSKSGYSLDALDGVFDVLQFSFLPFDEVPFEKSFLETDFYQFPDHYALVNLTPIRSREDYIDTLSTHPNILKRRLLIQNLKQQRNVDQGSVFIQSEDQFNKIRHLARLEVVNIFLTHHEYDKSFYNSYILLKQDPESQFLNTALVSSLYGIYKHKKNSDMNDCLEDYKKTEGEIQQSNYFLKKISQKEIALLVLRFSWLNSQKYPQCKYLKDISKDMFDDIFEMKIKILTDINPNDENSTSNVITKKASNKAGNSENLDLENSKRRESDSDSDTEEDSDDETHDGLYESYEKIVSLEDPKGNDKVDILNKIFVDLRKDSIFVTWVEKQRRRIIINSDISAEELLQDEMNSTSKIVVFDPNFYIVSSDISFKNKPKSIYRTILSVEIPKTKVDIFKYDDKTTTSTELYNIYCKVKEISYDLSSSNNNGMQLYQSRHLDKIRQYTGTSYVAFVDAMLIPPYWSADRLAVGIIVPIVPVLAPISLVHLLISKRRSLVEITFLNMETGHVKEYKVQNNGYSNHPFIHNFIYSTFKNFKKGTQK